MKQYFSWIDVVRIGLVQMSLGAIVILMTSTLNRVMVVELALPASLPGALVGWHYAVQMSRPRWGYGADQGGVRAPWIVGGMAVLGFGGILAALSAMVIPMTAFGGYSLAIVAFTLIGIGVGAAGTNALALLAAKTPPDRKAAAAAIVWIMMILGFVVTAATVGSILDPFSMMRLFAVCASVSIIAVAVTSLALWGLEAPKSASKAPTLGDVSSDTTKLAQSERPQTVGGFKEALNDVWQDQQARRFTVFVFVSMLAYNAQDLILEPFAGVVHGYSPGESTQLAGLQNAGVLLGMILTAIISTTIGKSRGRFMRIWTMAGCLASAISFVALAFGAFSQGILGLSTNVFLLGISNGAFAVAAIGSMMALASVGGKSVEGVRMGVWGAAQAIAFGLGGFVGAVAVDVVRGISGSPSAAFGTVFAMEAAVFMVAAFLAIRVGSDGDNVSLPAMPSAEGLAAE
ncbi:MAG: BCD family MFS transporter [Pseudomonadota bacterium]